MCAEKHESVARLLRDLRGGRRSAFDELLPIVYEELRALAHQQRRVWRDDSLNTTALVHEAYLKLVRRGNATWDTEAHFLAAAAQAIRHLLVTHARDRRTLKRGGGWQLVSLAESDLPGTTLTGGSPWADQVLALDQALVRLAGRSERQRRVVECRFFAGMTVQQTASALGLSTATVNRSWALARAWLYRELTGMRSQEV
jgi:RNA polymerase sigma factor (TIGR02999 family)